MTTKKVSAYNSEVAEKDRILWMKRNGFLEVSFSLVEPLLLVINHPDPVPSVVVGVVQPRRRPEGTQRLL